MANFDYNALLGKRVRLTCTFPNATVKPTGVFLGYQVIAPAYSDSMNPNEILFLEDGYKDPDWIVFDDLEVIG